MTYVIAETQEKAKCTPIISVGIVLDGFTGDNLVLYKYIAAVLNSEKNTNIVSYHGMSQNPKVWKI